LIENQTFKQSGKIDEEAVWWFGESGLEAFESLPMSDEEPGSQAFQEAQIFIQRATMPDQYKETAPRVASSSEQLYAIIDCGDNGARGRGSHAHSDALSIEVYALGETFLRDPGTFIYSASERWRNLFRSTAYHNTVRVDGEDISRIIE